MTETGPPARAPLQQGALKVFGAGDCQKAYPRAIAASMICTADRAHQAPPFVMACPGDSGGPVIVQTPSGPVQIGVTSWGGEVMDVGCGERSLPNVAMRVSSYSRVHQPGETGHPAVHDRSRFPPHAHHRRGPDRNTVTCTPPKIGGAPFKLTYEWSVGSSNVDIVPLRGAHGPKLKITKAIYERSLPAVARIVYCTATARNAGGSLGTGLTSARMKK